jgi:hypothetical protein
MFVVTGYTLTSVMQLQSSKENVIIHKFSMSLLQVVIQFILFCTANAESSVRHPK